jgi:hypothetical protein
MTPGSDKKTVVVRRVSVPAEMEQQIRDEWSGCKGFFTRKVSG